MANTLKILPREPLTKKARAAISKYAKLRSDGRNGLNAHEFMVGYVLEAERMRREKLYQYLEERGYRWRRGSWLNYGRDAALAAKETYAQKKPKKKLKGQRQRKQVAVSLVPVPTNNAELLEYIRNNPNAVSARKRQ